MAGDTEPPILLDKKRWLTLPVGLAVTAVIFLLTLGWKANGFLTSIQEENAATRRAMESLQSEVRASAAYRWTTGDMERWAYLLERSNRDLKLTVPDTRTVHTDRPGG